MLTIHYERGRIHDGVGKDNDFRIRNVAMPNPVLFFAFQSTLKVYYNAPLLERDWVRIQYPLFRALLSASL